MVAPDSGHHSVRVGVEDGQVQAAGHGHGEKRLVDQGSGGQTEGDVGYAQHRLQPKLVLDTAEGVQRLGGTLLFRRGGEGQAVDIYVLPADAVGQGRLQDAAGDVHPLLGGLGDAVLVKRQSHHGGPVLLDQGENGLHGFPVPIHRINDGLAAVDPEGPLQHLGVSGVQLKGGVAYPLDGLHRPDHHLLLVHLRQTYVYI